MAFRNVERRTLSSLGYWIYSTGPTVSDAAVVPCQYAYALGSPYSLQRDFVNFISVSESSWLGASSFTFSSALRTVINNISLEPAARNTPVIRGADPITINTRQ
jgi:hypothetical protein